MLKVALFQLPIQVCLIHALTVCGRSIWLYTAYSLVACCLTSVRGMTWSLSPSPGKQRLLVWLTSMDEMQAADELSPDQIRQLLFDLDSGYNAFIKVLH